MNAPLNASSLIAMREVRRVPELPVLVSLVGPLDFTNLTLHADAGETMDWHCLQALQVEVFASVDVPFAKVIRTLVDIAAVVPDRMVLAFTEGLRVECGESRRIYDDAGEFELFDWFPMAVGPNAYVSSQIIEKKLWKAIASQEIPTPFDRARELVGEIIKERNQ